MSRIALLIFYIHVTDHFRKISNKPWEHLTSRKCCACHDMKKFLFIPDKSVFLIL